MNPAPVLIAGGLVFTGEDRPPQQADILVRDGVIAEVGPNLSAAGARRVDAAGAWVTPGFVDVHSHADVNVLSGQAMEVRARAGVTTEIVGQDGLGFAPVSEASAQIMADVLAPITGLRSVPGWKSIGEYLDACDLGAYARVAMLVPHGAVRAAVLGAEDRPASPEERDAMRELVVQGMREGALGLSTGLTYPPGCFASTTELIELSRPVAQVGGRYVTHLRSYGDGFGEAIEEALTIGRKTPILVHFSHFHVSGAERAGKAEAYLSKLREARQQGVDVTLDAYPYPVACTFLASTLPGWLQGKPGGDLLEILHDDAVAQETAYDMSEHGPGETFAVGWEGLMLAGLSQGPDPDLDGLSILDAAAHRGQTVGELVVSLLRRYELLVCVLARQGHMDNVRRVAEEPQLVVGSDGILGSGIPHPRAAGSFLRYLRWARDGVIPVSTSRMVWAMTRQPASLFDLWVGGLELGQAADVLVLDPENLEDGPDVGPYVPSAVVWSFIAGSQVIEEGRWVGSPLRGMGLRRRGSIA